ncbi:MULTISPECIES: hypothetical protein [Halococcus]|uniref:Uncharacterized protein n=1 Tax=Halococcus salifodinae DSM 8989 TaxID=1227456 RepID=M0MYE7_9EURY|nr:MULTISPECIES: hypothetical protein [Halococcus]EMA49430.1 hypothetical protein C450_17067 [Halococcus salifodinae DSM 8989]
MKLTNRHGTPVDPVPFLVVASFAFLVSFSYGPIYCMALGLSLPAGLVVSTLVFSFSAGAAYHRFVSAARPELAGEIPAEARLGRLFYAIIVGIALLALLSLPLLVP